MSFSQRQLHRAIPVGLARRVAGVLALLSLGTALPARAQTPDTIIPIVNRAEATYETMTGVRSWVHDEARIDLRLRPGIRLSAALPARICGGESHLFTHTLTNTGNGPDLITLETKVPEGTRGTLYLGADRESDRVRPIHELKGPIELDRGESALILLEIETDPDLISLDLKIGLSAQSAIHPAMTAEVTNRLEICGPPPVLDLRQTANRTIVTIGDTITYSFEVENTGEESADFPVFTDTLPSELRLLPGTITLDSAAGPLTESMYRRELLDNGRELIRIPLDTIPGGELSGLYFQTIVIADSLARTITNTAHIDNSRPTIALAAERDVDEDNLAISNTVEVDVEFPTIELTLRVLGRSIIHVGDAVTFELTYQNTSNVPVSDAILRNVLPREMTYLGADPAPDRTSEIIGVGGAGSGPTGESGTSPFWIEWDLGTVESGEGGVLLLRALLNHLPTSGKRELENHATLSAGAAGYRVTVAAKAEPTSLNDGSSATIALEKSAGQMEVGLGEAVPYALEIENISGLVLHDVVIRDWLPAELELVTGSLIGTDSLRIDGREHRFYLPGPLEPGTKRLVRYTAITTEAPGKPIANRARAEAEDGRVFSDTAIAWVRVRQGPSVPARTLIGKVWVDQNGDGRQGPGDHGLGGVDIWTADGQVVRTDAEGRFSLQDLEPGRYTLRIDMLGLDDRYEIAGVGRNREIREVRLDGWTMGQVEFRLVPRRIAADYHAGPPAELLTAGVAATDTTASPDEERNGGSPNGRSTTRSSSGTRISVEAARSADTREAERRREFISGPGIEFTSPGDGSVLPSSRIYIGVRAEAGRPVQLMHGDSIIREGTVRPDGVFDFIAVDLERGPNLFRVRTTNSWGNERWDSIAVHRSGAPATFVIEHSPEILRAEAPEVDTLLVRVLDEWGVPVVTSPIITAEVSGLTIIEGSSSDRGSPYHELRPDSAGWLAVPLRAGQEIGRGHIALRAGAAKLDHPVQILAPVRPLIATATGRLGIGSAEDGSYASITARGAIDEITSITVSYDSRRGDQMASFRRAYDPLDESLYPTTGDRSERRILSGSADAFSARIERGLDWIAFGDVRTEGFTGNGELTSYDRSLSGVASRLTTGPVVLHGFGSATRQLLEEIQLRGEGSSGPYRLGGEIRPGTDRLAIEIRARDNAARVISRTELIRYSDYQIDYRTGDILLNRLLPATDAHGNSIFLVATVERLDSDERHWVGGLRLEYNASEALKIAAADSVGISIFGVRDGAEVATTSVGLAGSDLLGGEILARIGASHLGAEILQASADSTGLAGKISLEWEALQDRGRIRGEWLNVGDGFSQRQNPRLRSGLAELRLGGDLRITEGLNLSLDHDRQSFRAFDVERQTSRARVEHTRGEQVYSIESGLIQESRDGTSTGNSLMTRVNATLSPAITLWAENRHLLKEPEAGLPASHANAGQIGAGISLRLLERVRLDGQYRRIDADDPYTLSSVTLNVDSWKGGRVWGGLESADGGRQESGVNLGWNQTVQLPAGWSINSQLERRFGLDDLTLADPVRALPFPQIERNRTSGGLGLQWRGGGGDHSFSARGEFNDGDLNDGYRFESLADFSLGDDAALLMRHDWLRNDRSLGQVTETERREHSLLGLAFRPTASNTLNALAKVEWRRTVRPETGTNTILAGDNARLIGAADLVWSPEIETQLTFRYAIRGSTYSNQAFGDLEVESRSHFFGTSLERHLYRRASGRLDSRVLHLSTTGDSRWSIAPTLVVDLSEIEIEAGYRFGDLRDIDFAGRGGLGFFASIGLRLTERSAANAAGFWRNRVTAH